MKEIILKIEKLSHCKDIPQYQTLGSAGMDLRAAIDKDVTITPLARIIVPIGIKIELPRGYEAQIRPRSGLAIKSGITIINAPGTIDEDYRGEIMVGLINLSNQNYTVHPNDRVAQMVINKITKPQIKVVTTLSDTNRGDGGFGSTGIK